MLPHTQIKKGSKTMALPITILKNVLKLNLMHVEKCEEAVTTYQAYGETYQQPSIFVYARPFKKNQCLCPKCKKKCILNGHKMEEESKWRASNLNGMPVYILYRPQRIWCPEHGALNEFIPWADGTSRFTPSFNDEVAWFVCQMSKTAISEYLSINWRTVGNCIKASHVRLEPDVSQRIHDSVRRICVDEVSYKKGYKYITVVYDMDKNRVIWIHRNHGYEVFAEFCQLLTPEERENIEVVAGDGASWIDSCCKEFFPNATRCIDFFHVAQWINKALDEVRISTATKARREYNNLRNEYIKAEAEAAAASEKAKQDYLDAIEELSTMPRCGRPSIRKLELISFIEEYESAQEQATENSKQRSAGRPKRVQLTPEHEATLKELSNRIDDFKGAKFALGHNPENCTDNQIEKIQLIENNYPDLYRAYQLKEALRLILHMKDYEQAFIELVKWINDARNSGLKPMKELADKIETRHKENILNSIKYQANSAKSESTNTTIKGLIKLARGFRNLDNMIALIYLKCSDIVVPLCNRPQPSADYLAKKRARANELRRLREEQRQRDFAA